MTKNDIADELVSQTTFTKSQALNAIDGLMKIASNAFAKGENIYLRGFGTFRVVERKAKTARNIRWGTSVTVPAHHAVKFIPSNELKDLVK
ncbi:MAG: integration host factor subunit beta [Prevotella sp.]|nr:integration host factor subunit beta [Prevotella sp.]